MIEYDNKTGGQNYQKHNFKKTNKQTDKQSGKKQTNEQLSIENCSQFTVVKIMTRVAG